MPPSSSQPQRFTVHPAAHSHSRDTQRWHPRHAQALGCAQHSMSPGWPGSAQRRVGTIKKGLARLHRHGAAGSRYLILAGMCWGQSGPCCGGLTPACCDGGVDVGPGGCIHRWGVNPELVSPWDIATTPRYEDAAGLGSFAHHQPRPLHWHAWHPMGSVPYLAHPPLAPGMWLLPEA